MFISEKMDVDRAGLHRFAARTLAQRVAPR